MRGNDPSSDGNEMRVLVLPPTRADADAMRKVLAASGIKCEVLRDLVEICQGIHQGAGSIVLSEEALAADTERLAACLQEQPVWSDLPVLVLSRAGAETASLAQSIGRIGNVSIVERPVRTTTLVSLIKSSLRARQRQYQVRDHLGEQEQAKVEREALLESERTARSEAERAGRMKDEFLATLGHELRTPLNAILGWSQILRDCAVSNDVVEGLTVIERNARAQTQIIEDLLDMSRIISGKVRLDVQRMDLIATVQAAIETIRPAAQGKNIQLHAVLDTSVLPVMGDPNRLQQVFWNLLTNAIKFTPKDGRINIRLERADSHLQVTIADSGEGIDPDFLPFVFDRFRQADASTTRRHGGLGLGLSIVKQLVEMHGGTISARSEGKGCGSIFCVTLPLMAMNADTNPGPETALCSGARKSPAQSPDPMSPTLHGVKVLVVDDEADARSLVRRILESCNATVLAAGSAPEALDLLMHDRPDVLVSDIGMPTEDGYALIRKIRSWNDDRANTPAIAITAYARTEDRIKAINAGFQMHLAKPVEPKELIAMVWSLARRQNLGFAHNAGAIEGHRD